jgi:phosphoribosylamine--glycine ligase
MNPSQDHKRIFDGDQGPNTGGMGAYSPTPQLSDKELEFIKTHIAQKTIEGMALEDRPYRGVLYAGLVLTEEGPKVLEYNCRFGDPETQAVLPLADSDLLEVMITSRDGGLAGYDWKNKNKSAVCIVIASGGYPGKYEKGKVILGLDQSEQDDIMVYHAGTQKVDDKIVTAGGRVLGVTALGDELDAAIKKAYNTVSRITFDGAYYRRDIAAKALKYKKRG